MSPALRDDCGVAGVTMTSTLSRTNSAAISAKRSVRPSAQRYSIATVRPSIQPSSRSRCTKAAVHWPQAEAVAAAQKPDGRQLAVCCARAASGHAAAAPPSSVMNSRRLVCRERSIVRGDEGRIMPRAPVATGSPQPPRKLDRE